MILSFFIRATLFLLTAGLWYTGLWPVATIFTFVYLFRYLAYEIVILGLVLDIQFMTGLIPWYSLIFAVAFVGIEWCKPRLLAYSH